jgi:hypothetical protein
VAQPYGVCREASILARRQTRTSGPPTDSATPAGCPPEVLHLFEQYLQNDIDRCAFLEGAASFMKSGASAEELLEELRMRYAENH